MRPVDPESLVPDPEPCPECGSIKAAAEDVRHALCRLSGREVVPMSTDPIRQRLDNSNPFLAGHAHRAFKALYAVLDLCDEHALCPALADCERDPSSCNEADIRAAIAEKLGVADE